jgi:hypothetical protein
MLKPANVFATWRPVKLREGVTTRVARGAAEPDGHSFVVCHAKHEQLIRSAVAA